MELGDGHRKDNLTNSKSRKLRKTQKDKQKSWTSRNITVKLLILKARDVERLLKALG